MVLTSSMLGPGEIEVKKTWSLPLKLHNPVMETARGTLAVWDGKCHDQAVDWGCWGDKGNKNELCLRSRRRRFVRRSFTRDLFDLSPKGLTAVAGRGRRRGVHLVLCGSPRGSEAKGRRRRAGPGAQSECAVSWVRGLAALSSWASPGPPGPWYQSRTSAPWPSQCCHLAVTLSVHVSLESLESGCRLGVSWSFHWRKQWA